jgi:amidase
MIDPLSRLSATDVVQLLRSNEVSALELVEIALKRIAEVEPKINALPTVCAERAREKARAITNSRGRGKPAANFLYGLPIAVKDNVDVAGVVTTHGSTIYRGNLATHSDVLVETLEHNGAIVIAKSNLPEFAAGGNTFNDVFGPTRNPWNSRLSAGGSSGGSAAALASGEVWLATGNDLAGSVRVPASFCSVVGLRPSPGRIARGPRKQMFSPLSVEGPMARCVADIALMLDAQVGATLRDPISLPRPAFSFARSIGRRPVSARIAFSENLGISEVDGEVATICRNAIMRTRDLYAVVADAHPDLTVAEQTFETLRCALFVGRVGHLLADHRSEMKPEVVHNAEAGLAIGPEELTAAENARDALYFRMIEFFNGYDFLVCPTAPVPPFGLQIRYPDSLNGVPFRSYISWLKLTFAITLSGCPAISLPCGFTGSGAPVGLQIVAPPRAERRLLSFASHLEGLLECSTSVPIEPC